VECRTLWGEPEWVQVQNMEQLHVHDRYQNVIEHKTLGHSIWNKSTDMHNTDFGIYRLQTDGPVPYQSVFFKEKPSFWQTCPKVKFAVSSYFYSTKKSSFSLWVRYLKKNHSDRARRVVHWLPCWMFHASLCTIQSKKFCGDFHF